MPILRQVKDRIHPAFDDDDEAVTLPTLAAAERLARLGTLVAGVAHEINNPISYVLANLEDLRRLGGALREVVAGYRSLLAAGGADRGRALELEGKLREAGGLELFDELLADALEGAMRIRSTVRDLLAVSRGGSATDEPARPLDVNEVLASTLRLMSFDLASVATVDSDLRARSLVVAQRGKLGQIFLNLLANARDACQPADPSTQRIEVRSADRGERVVIEVQDSGGGIPAEVRTSLFAPFFTTKPSGRGTGLGLHLSRRIVREHGGELEFHDAPGGGTIFRVSLPAVEAAPDEQD